jgi:hypothetical protein
MLYQPAASEIGRLINAGAANHPQYKAYYERARELLRQEALDHTPAGWIIASQSGNETYCLEIRQCTCKHFQTGGINIKDRRYCKHLLAFTCYRTILEANMNRRLVGSYTFESDRYIARNYPNTLLIQMAGYACSFNHEGRLPYRVARINKTKFGYKFYHSDAMANYAEWLATAPAIPPFQRMELNQPQPTTQQQRNEWLRTLTTEQLARLAA